MRIRNFKHAIKQIERKLFHLQNTIPSTLVLIYRR